MIVISSKSKEKNLDTFLRLASRDLEKNNKIVLISQEMPKMEIYNRLEKLIDNHYISTNLIIPDLNDVDLICKYIEEHPDYIYYIDQVELLKGEKKLSKLTDVSAEVIITYNQKQPTILYP